MIYLYRKPTPESKEKEKDPNNKVVYLSKEPSVIDEKEVVEIIENNNIINDKKVENPPIRVDEYLNEIKILDIETSAVGVVNQES